MNLEKGSIIQHYKIISAIGKGGMGEVFLAQDTKLDRKGISLVVVLMMFLFLPLEAQQTPQTPSTMAETTRPHPRIAQVETPGRKVELYSAR